MPRFFNMREAARRIREQYFPVSHRTIERWSDMPGRVINKQRLYTQEEIEAAVKRRIAAAESKTAQQAA